MSSFLHLLAKDLIQKYSYNFDNLTILFPNKRAGLFLAQELAQLIDRPVWMPEILTLSEFIERQTGLKKAEELTLIIKLYKTYQEYAGTTERFDDFYFWGNMLLGDFDDIGTEQEDVADEEADNQQEGNDHIAFPVVMHHKEQQERRDGHGACHCNTVSAGKVV